MNALLAHCDDLRGIGGELRPGIVHRIDKDTSGLLVVAKDDATMIGAGRRRSRRTTSSASTRRWWSGKPPARERAHRHAARARSARPQEVLDPREARAAARSPTGGCVERFAGAARMEARARDRAHAPGARAHGGARAARCWRDRDLRAAAARSGAARDRRGAGAAGAARAHAGLRAPGDGQDADVHVGAAARISAALAALRRGGSDASRSRGRCRGGPGRAAAAAVGADPGAVSPRLHHARGRRQRARRSTR